MTYLLNNEQRPRSVLVVAAHPDDETLGCGATLARYADQGAAVHVLFMTDGVSAREDVAEQAAAARRRAAEQAAEVLGIRQVNYHDFPDNRLDSVPLLEVIRAVETHLHHIAPDTVLTHFIGDLNIDHAITARAVATACRPLPETTVRQLLAFEVPSSTEWGAGPELFRPQWFVNIESTLERKQRALACYRDEIRKAPHARSAEAVQALALQRGYSVGLPCAEAFMLLRRLC